VPAPYTIFYNFSSISPVIVFAFIKEKQQGTILIDYIIERKLHVTEMVLINLDNAIAKCNKNLEGSSFSAVFM
jgi:hypothetical protein